MILLQAIVKEHIVVYFLGILLLVAVPILVTALMKVYGNIAGKRGNIKVDTAHFKEMVPFASIIIFSIIALLLLIYLLVALFERLASLFN